jgi:Plasmid recombination enzyme
MSDFVVFHIEKADLETDIGSHNRRAHYTTSSIVEYRHLNEIIIDHGTNLKKTVDDRIKEGVTSKKAIRKDAVKCIEVMLSGSKEVMNNMDELTLSRWVQDNKAFVEEEYGKENVISFCLHRDETTPHVHALIVPITIEKKRYDQNKKETVIATAGRLSAKEVMGSRSDLREVQTRYAEKMKKYGLRRGIEGSNAIHDGKVEYERRIKMAVEPEKFEIKKVGLLNRDESAESAVNRMMEEIVMPMKAQIVELKKSNGKNQVKRLQYTINEANKKTEQLQKDLELVRSRRDLLLDALKKIVKGEASLEGVKEWMIDNKMISQAEIDRDNRPSRSNDRSRQ